MCCTAPAPSRPRRPPKPKWRHAAPTCWPRACPGWWREEDGRVLGFAYCQWFKPRPAYRFCAEDSIYVAPDAQGRGVGGRLLAELARQAQAAGIRKLLAVIGDSANQASIGVHRALGFTPAGVVRSCGWKFDRWLDIVLMEKFLGAGDSTPPEDRAA